MAKEKKQPHKIVMTEGKRDIIRSLLSEYDIQSAQDIQDALKDTFRQVFVFYKIDHRLGYTSFSEGRSFFMAGIFFVKGSFWRRITVIVGRIVL